MKALQSASSAAIIAAILSYAAQSHAQTAAHLTEGAKASTTTTEGTLPEIVVTARRRVENLQIVPQTVTAVSGEMTQKLAITQFQDVAAVVPGLTLGSGNPATGGFAAPSIRGVPSDFLAGNPTVDIYFNEVPFSAGLAYAGIYDVGSIQVLQGPQGTARGRTAPSGAILLSFRRPDLKEAGGYVSALGATEGESNFQAALNVPIIRDVLAVRASGLFDHTRGNFVRSVNSSTDPKRQDISGRITALYSPTDNFDAQVSYQRLHQDLDQFTQVEGAGAPGGVSILAPAGYNGPLIEASNRLGVDDFPSATTTVYNLVTAQVNWKIPGHRISYIGGYWNDTIDASRATDTGNLVLGHPLFQVNHQTDRQWSHELRLASDGPGHLFDYTLGYFYDGYRSDANVTQPQVFLTGAFGPPGSPADPHLFDPRYVLPVLTAAPGTGKENSFFATATIHAGPRTEITLGGRYLLVKRNSDIVVSLGSGAIAATPNFGLPCAALSPLLVDSHYPGFCDFPIQSPGVVQNLQQPRSDHPFVYNVSISHRFTDDIMAYGTVASSYRLSGVNIGVNNANNDPLLSQLQFPPSEKSTSFELGLKTSWLDRRLRLNVAAFHQKFNGMLFQTPAVPYRSVNVPGTDGTVGSFGFNVAADSVVNGVNVDAAFQPIRNWTMSADFSYAKAQVDNDTVPCRDANFDGVPDLGTPTLQGFIDHNTYVALCKTNQVVTRDPLWTMTVQSEYWRPLGPVDAYVRGLFTYYPENPNQSPGFTVKNYGLLNLYAGVRSPDGAWDIGLFARNLANTGVELSRALDDVALGNGAVSSFGRSGYVGTSFTPPRQYGVNVRYAFGSR